MAYNLDFSGWKDMRKAMADSIINQANIAANLIADKAGVLNKIISTGIGAGSRAYSDYRKKKEQEHIQEAVTPSFSDDEYHTEDRLNLEIPSFLRRK